MSVKASVIGENDGEEEAVVIISAVIPMGVAVPVSVVAPEAAEEAFSEMVSEGDEKEILVVFSE